MIEHFSPEITIALFFILALAMFGTINLIEWFIQWCDNRYQKFVDGCKLPDIGDVEVDGYQSNGEKLE